MIPPIPIPVRRQPYVLRSSPWTAARVAELTRRWSQGVSAARIADEFGCGVSRNAVTAKVHRLGIGALSPYGGGRPRRRKARAIVAALAAAGGSPALLPLFRSRPLPPAGRYPRPHGEAPRLD